MCNSKIAVSILLATVVSSCDMRDERVVAVGDFQFYIPEAYGSRKNTGYSDAKMTSFSITVTLPEWQPATSNDNEPGYGNRIVLYVVSEPLFDIESFVQTYISNGQLEPKASNSEFTEYFFHSLLNRAPSSGDSEMYISALGADPFRMRCHAADDGPTSYASCKLDGSFESISYSANFSKAHKDHVLEIHRGIKSLLASMLIKN